MEVILIRDIDRLGKSNSIVNVKDGFARNFLIPNKLAIPLTSENIKKLEQDKQNKLLQSEKVKKLAQDQVKSLSSLSLTIPVLTLEDDRLYGSITAQDIAAGLKDEGIEIDKNSIILAEPIKNLGIYEVAVKLHPEVTTTLKVWIVKK
jgi:large subunit ribosomal protein L9